MPVFGANHISRVRGITFKVKKSLRTAFLYIGTAIGAGFSSGKEIALFFGKASPLNVALTSVFMALLCGLFLVAGKQNMMPKSRLMRFGIFLSACISLCSMLAGGEYVMRTLSGIPLLGLVMAILGAIVVILGIEKMKAANCVLVPLIVLSIALIFFKLPHLRGELPFDIARPMIYSGLDVLLGGVIIADEGKKLNYRQIFGTCMLIFAFLFGMLFMLQTVVLADGCVSSMPVLAVAKRFGLQAICGVLIAAAIFTTLISSLKIVSDSLLAFLRHTKRLSSFGDVKNTPFAVFLCLLIAYPVSFVGFDNIVNTMYPFISVCGILMTAIVLVRFCIKAVLLIKRRRSYSSSPPRAKKRYKKSKATRPAISV